VILLAALALALSPVHPWPIGAGPKYQLPAATAAVRAGRPVGPLLCSVHPVRFNAHVEVFAKRRVVILPAGIGRGPGCVYPSSTNAPTGVVRLTHSVMLGDLFRVWGQALGSHRLSSFRGTVQAFVAGRRWLGDPREIGLTNHTQVVVEIGGYVPPHPSYLFPKGKP
jgi:hypothetical protein